MRPQVLSSILAGTGAALVLAGCVAGPTPPATVNPYRPVIERRVTGEPAVKPFPSIMRRTGVETRSRETTVTVTNRTQLAEPDRQERVLRKGDRVQVTIYAPPEPFSSPNVIDEEGRINFPLIGPIVVAGKTCSDAQQAVEKAYIDKKIYKTVTVVIVPPEGEYAVTGEVIRPGPYPLTRDQTLLQALARAGRYTPYADKTKVYLTRNNDRVEIKLDDIREGRRKDIVIIPGDVIEVPLSPW